MATMLPSKTKSGLSESPNNKTTPATPRRPATPKTAQRPTTPKTGKVNRSGSLKSDQNSASPVQNPRISIDRSPKSVDSKPTTIDRRSPKISTPADKQPQPRNLKGSELQSHLETAQEELKKAKEQLSSLEQEKITLLEELKDAKRIADVANENLQEAIVAKKRAEEETEIEKFRAVELEQTGIDTAQRREDEWRKELEKIKNQHESDISTLISTREELERMRYELATAVEAKNNAVSRADKAVILAQANAEKVGVLSREMNRLKALLDSSLENKNSENDEIVKKLESEIVRLNGEIEKTRGSEEELTRLEELIERFKCEIAICKSAESDAVKSGEELKKRVEELEIRLEEANESEKCKAESLAAAMQQLEEKAALLNDKETQIGTLKEKIEGLESDVARQKEELEESSQRFDAVRQEVFELETTVDVLRNKLETTEEAKLEAISNEKAANCQVDYLTGEKEKLIHVLETVREDGERDKKAMEDLTSALHEVSTEARELKEKLLTKETEHEHALAQIGDLKLALKNTKESYEVMLDEANYEIICLRKTVENLETEAKNQKEERDSRDLDFASSNKQSEEEITALKVEVERVLASLRGTDHEIHVAKEEKVQLMEKLSQAESAASETSKIIDEAKAESLRLRERLLDKENELQSISQENEELRARESAALERINELSTLLDQARTVKVVGESAGEEAGHVGRCDKPTPVEQEAVGDLNGYKADKPDPNQVEEDTTNGEEEQEELGKVDSNKWESSNTMEEEMEDQVRERESETETGQLDPKLEDNGSDHKNGPVLDETGNGPNGADLPANNNKQTTEQQQKKKSTPLFKKFGNILRKKNSQK